MRAPRRSAHLASPVAGTAPAVYRLTAQLPGSGTSCVPPLASDIELVARRNRVKGTLDVTGSLTCANLVLAKLEARNGS
jgi:hypothetical protein